METERLVIECPPEFIYDGQKLCVKKVEADPQIKCPDGELYFLLNKGHIIIILTVPPNNIYNCDLLIFRIVCNSPGNMS